MLAPIAVARTDRPRYRLSRPPKPTVRAYRGEVLTTTGPTWRRRLGDRNEQQARAYLERQGLSLIAQNVRCKRGELDLVMRDQDTLVFVEVRYRASERFGGAAASVSTTKQARITAAAAYYLQRHPANLPCRFDVVAIDGAGTINWIRHAFAAPS